MIEVKISEEQYNTIEALRYDVSQKNKYVIDNILHDKYQVNEDTFFFAYKDIYHFYVVFEGEKISNGKIPISANILPEKPKENK